MHKLQYQSKNDIIVDFTGQQYNLLTFDMNDKIKSSNILINSFTNTKYEDMFLNILNKFKDDKLLWSIKNINNNIEWELYFQRNLVNLHNSKEKLKKYFDFPISHLESINHFIWSVNINDFSFKEINLYTLFDAEKFGDYLHFGAFSYSYDGINYEHQSNYYAWKESLKNINRIKDNIYSSFFGFNGKNMEDIIIPEFLEWYKNDVSKHGIWISNKKYCDSIYYQSLNVDMLIIFLKKFNYPQNQIGFLEDNKNNLDHLLYDVAIDYKVENKKFKIIKTGYYGTI